MFHSNACFSFYIASNTKYHKLGVFFTTNPTSARGSERCLFSKCCHSVALTSDEMRTPIPCARYHSPTHSEPMKEEWQLEHAMRMSAEEVDLRKQAALGRFWKRLLGPRRTRERAACSQLAKPSKSAASETQTQPPVTTGAHAPDGIGTAEAWFGRMAVSLSVATPALSNPLCCFAARDKQMMELIMVNWVTLGDRAISDRKTRLHISSSHPKNVSRLEVAVREFCDDLPPKIAKLDRLLKSMMQPRRKDPVLRVLAQDIYRMNIFWADPILVSMGMPALATMAELGQKALL
ncbi:hypothetical protein BC940DRAFT_315483 [Gongronella butleri]|nr:hypothetical protein BC940DRAFT_315483 [Gongronella butleri]